MRFIGKTAENNDVNSINNKPWIMSKTVECYVFGMQT